MAEYKGKLLKGLFRQAKDILMSDGTDAETAINDKAYSKLGFTGILNALTAKVFITNVCADLTTKLTKANQMVNIGYVWGGVDAFVGYATVRDTGHILGSLSSASSAYASYTFDYTISSGTARITQITGTSL